MGRLAAGSLETQYLWDVRCYAFWLSNWKDETVHWGTTEWNRFGDKDRLTFGHVKTEMPTRHSNGDTGQNDEHTNLKIRRKICKRNVTWESPAHKWSLKSQLEGSLPECAEIGKHSALKGLVKGPEIYLYIKIDTGMEMLAIC